MKKNVFYLLLLLVLFAAWTAPAVFAAEYDVKISEKEGLGKFFTDGKGMTLYIFKNDSPNKSACTGGCIERWPLFYPGNLRVAAGVNEKDFSVITRDSGQKQLTYKGMPLYYFYQDEKAGDTTGQGLNKVWFVANP